MALERSQPAHEADPVPPVPPGDPDTDDTAGGGSDQDIDIAGTEADEDSPTKSGTLMAFSNS